MLESNKSSCENIISKSGSESIKKRAQQLGEDIKFGCKEDRIMEVFGKGEPDNTGIDRQKIIGDSIYATQGFEKTEQKLKSEIGNDGADLITSLGFYIPFTDPEYDQAELQGLNEIVDIIKDHNDSGYEYKYTYGLITEGAILDKRTEFTSEFIQEIYKRIKTILYDCYKIENNKDVIDKAVSIGFSGTELMKIIEALGYTPVNQSVIDSLSSDMTVLEVIQKISK